MFRAIGDKDQSWLFPLTCYDLFLSVAKSQELKKDIEILSQTFERIIDRKEAIIKSLVKDIEEAEEQYQMALRSHLQNVDRLIGGSLSRLSIQALLAVYWGNINVLNFGFPFLQSSKLNHLLVWKLLT